MNTAENNKLIAEFMGLKPTPIRAGLYGLAKSPWVAVTGENPEKVMEQFCKSTKYHDSWDWLMPVILKMNNTEEWEKFEISHLSICLVSVDLEASYDEVIRFIKWYNDKQVNN
jgi:hypothetical protein